MMLLLYLSFWFSFIIIAIIFFTIIFLFNFFRNNGLKPFFLIFNRENKILLITMVVFTIIYWTSFLIIFNISRWPELTFYESSKGNDYSSTCTFKYDCPEINHLNFYNPKDITLEATEVTRNFIKFKLNILVFVSRCDNCNYDIIEAGHEYQLNKNENIYFKIIDNEKNMSYNYQIRLG